MATPVRFIARADVERLLDLDRLIEGLAGAFAKLSQGAASVPPRIAAMTPEGLLAAMPGYLPGAGLETKLVSVFPGNHERGLPSHQALIALFDEETGIPRAVLDGTAITAIRTGAASALATRLLARPDARVLAILGAGVQGRSHLAAVRRVREFSQVRVASRRPEHARALAEEAGITACDDFASACRGADVVCCCTDAGAPVVELEWLAPGAHVTSVGASRQGPELSPEVVSAADALAVESRAAFLPYPAGAHELQGLNPERGLELGELVLQTRPGRSRPDQLTVYKSMGHAVEDLVAARLVLDAADAAGAGTLVDM